MRQVKLDATIRGVSAEHVYRQVPKFEHYPTLAPHVRATIVHATLPEPVGSSSWDLHFRSGLLRWTERDEFFTDRLRIEFTQTEGDFEEFAGFWQLAQQGEDTALSFRCDFDFGIPSLEGILDPIAERVIRETVAWAVTGLLEPLAVEFDEVSATVPASAASAG